MYAGILSETFDASGSGYAVCGAAAWRVTACIIAWRRKTAGAKLDDYGFFGHFRPHNLRQCRMQAGSLPREKPPPNDMYPMMMLTDHPGGQAGRERRISQRGAGSRPASTTRESNPRNFPKRVAGGRGQHLDFTSADEVRQ